jgi:hypothetical protein
MLVFYNDGAEHLDIRVLEPKKLNRLLINLNPINMIVYTVKFKFQGQVHTKMLFGKEEMVSFFDNEGQRVDVISIAEQALDMNTTNSRRTIR